MSLRTKQLLSRLPANKVIRLPCTTAEEVSHCIERRSKWPLLLTAANATRHRSGCKAPLWTAQRVWRSRHCAGCGGEGSARGFDAMLWRTLCRRRANLHTGPHLDRSADGDEAAAAAAAAVAVAEVEADAQEDEGGEKVQGWLVVKRQPPPQQQFINRGLRIGRYAHILQKWLVLGARVFCLA